MHDLDAGFPQKAEIVIGFGSQLVEHLDPVDVLSGSVPLKFEAYEKH